MVARLFVVAAVLIGTSAALAAVMDSEVVPTRESFAVFPMTLGAWQGARAADFDDAIVAELGVDEYLNVVYRGPSRSVVGLYVGFYMSQRQGDTIHSPANCIPGSGWQPVETGRMTIAVSSGVTGPPNRNVEVSRWLIQKGDEQQLVLYWYQSHGRVVASEYWNKIHLVADAIRLNRTDAALVRVITPVSSTSSRGLAEAEERAISFVQSMFPALERFLPL